METINFNLPESPVVFEPEHHTYNLDGKMLSGVTAIVKWLFPDTYAGIPEAYGEGWQGQHHQLLVNGCLPSYDPCLRLCRC